MNLKPTPTPWTIEQVKSGRNLRIQSGNKIICWMSNLPDYPAVQEYEANAKFLVSAANTHDEAKTVLLACLDRLTEMGFSIHEPGLPQKISKLLSKMEE